MLVCVACFSPIDSFFAFDKQKLIHLDSFYLNDFSLMERFAIGDELDAYIFDMCNTNEFTGLRSLCELAHNLICSKRSGVYPSVYQLLQLALLLLAATTIVKRAFSAMKIIKNYLHNRMRDQLLNDSMIVYIEKKKLNELSNEAII